MVFSRKNFYIEEIVKARPSNRKEAEVVLKRIMGDNLIRIIKQHNTQAVLAVHSFSENLRILKIEVGVRPQKTINEINWYSFIKNHSSGAYRIPAFWGGLYDNKVAIYELDFLSNHSLLEDLVTSSKISGKDVKNYIVELLRLIFDFFELNETKVVPFERAEELYWTKIKQRVHDANKINWLRALLHQKIIKINDESFLGLPYILNEISRINFRKKFTPRYWGFVHGDLHFGNILVDGKDIKLIDPNGKLEMPLEYDIGKLFHSIHGYYNYIHKGKFDIQMNSLMDNLSFQFDIKNKVFSEGQFFLFNNLSEEVLLRSLFSEACHFLTMLPHHAKNRVETVALYLQSIKLFHDFLKKIKD